MAMSAVWSALVLSGLVFGLLTGRLEEVSAAAAQGAQSAVELCVSMAGVLCLWSGVIEVMRRCGLLEALGRLLSPLLMRLFPRAGQDRETMALITANVSANLLGLGNAATPPGIEAVRRMASRSNGRTDGELCRFVVCNTASIQLIPTTVAALRSGAGCRTPFDILPAVWFSSAAALFAGLAACLLLERIWGDAA